MRDCVIARRIGGTARMIGESIFEGERRGEEKRITQALKHHSFHSFPRHSLGWYTSCLIHKTDRMRSTRRGQQTRRQRGRIRPARDVLHSHERARGIVRVYNAGDAQDGISRDVRARSESRYTGRSSAYFESW